MTAESQGEEGGIIDLEATYFKRILALESERDALKAELEDKKGFMGRGYYIGMEETYSKRIEELMKERDRWRRISQRLLDRMKIINGPQESCAMEGWKVCENHRLIQEVQEAFSIEEVAKK